VTEVILWIIKNKIVNLGYQLVTIIIELMLLLPLNNYIYTYYEL